MRTMFVVALSLWALASASSATLAADCKVMGWTNGYGAAPIFQCPDNTQR